MADIQDQGAKSMNNNQDRQKLLQLTETIKTANAFIQTNLDKRIISWNEVAEKIYGYSASEVTGKDLFSLLVPEELRTLSSNEQMEEIDPYKQIHRRKDGKLIHVRMSMALIKNAKGDVTGYSILVKDVTEHRLKAPMPKNEGERLAALYNYKILDTAPEEIFDDFTKLASYILKTPIALISLIDADRQWVKSKVGLNISETSRDVAFCGYAILQEDVLIVEDALADERFANNPLVTGDPNIRFYAGAPLITSSGVAVGTVCAIDKIPRKLSREQVEMLQILSRQIVQQLELRNKPENFDVLKKEIEELKSLVNLDIEDVFGKGIYGLQE